MAQIRMTENVGDSGLRFEIWFRRRWKSQDTYIRQASSAEVKTSWTDVIGKVLWWQALRSRELRTQEMVSTGIGSKPSMDVKPSNAAISDRAISYTGKGTEAGTRASTAVPSCDHTAPLKRLHSTLSDSSTSSSSSRSSSARGPLPPARAHKSRPLPLSVGVRTCTEQGTGNSESSHRPSGDSGPSLAGRPCRLRSCRLTRTVRVSREGSRQQPDGDQFITAGCQESHDT